MTRRSNLTHEFVEYVPEILEDGKIYVSMRFATAVHRCCCGCGIEVATPFSPADWQLMFDGGTVTLSPSIGNWSLPCQSHYWIRQNQVVWARPWTTNEIAAGRARDHRSTELRFSSPEYVTPNQGMTQMIGSEPKTSETFWRRVRRRLWRSLSRKD